jgi:DNA-binding NtrC family response regulator
MEKEAKMTLNDMRILIVADDADGMAALTASLMTRLDADVTMIGSIEEAKGIIASSAFDIILAAGELPDGSGLSLLSDDLNHDMPLLLLDTRLDTHRVLSALRCGAIDVLIPPFDVEYILDVIQRSVMERRDRRRREIRTARLRRLSARLIRDRRELRQRVDLICNDLVRAYHRLAEKVVGAENSEFVGERPHPLDS